MAELARSCGWIIRAQVRSQTEYRLSFALGVLSDILAQATELVAIIILFSRVDALGSFSGRDVLLMYAIASTAFGLAELCVGQMISLPRYIRSGDFVLLLMRPLSAFLQLIASDVQLRRVGRVVVGVAVLGYALDAAEIQWTTGKLLLTITSPIVGAVIIGSVWVAGSVVSFWLIDGQDFIISITYGTNLLTSYPMTVYPALLRGVLGFVVPVAFVAYYPTLALIDREDPLGGPGLLSWIGPLVALICAAAAARLWRLGLQHYEGTGS